MRLTPRRRGARFAEQLAPLTPTHVHAHFMGAPTLVGHAMARMMGLSFTFSCHASDVFTAGDPTPEEHAAVYDAHAIIACSEYLRKHLIERRGYPREKVITIHHGIDLSRVPERAAPTDSTEPVLVAVGRLVPKKGFDVLLRAAAPMLKQDRIALRIVGEGPEGTRLRALAVDLGVLDRVEFLGRLTWEDTLRTIAESSALIAPSVTAEDGDMDGIPNVLLEAGALGVPVIASRLSGIPELVEDGKTGLLTASGDEGALGKARRVATRGPRAVGGVLANGSAASGAQPTRRPDRWLVPRGLTDCAGRRHEGACVTASPSAARILVADTTRSSATPCPASGVAGHSVQPLATGMPARGHPGFRARCADPRSLHAEPDGYGVIREWRFRSLSQPPDVIVLTGRRRRRGTGHSPAIGFSPSRRGASSSSPSSIARWRRRPPRPEAQRPASPASTGNARWLAKDATYATL